MSVFFRIIFLLLLNLFTFTTKICLCSNQFEGYKGAVVEYKPEGNPFLQTPEEILNLNTQNYINYIEKAANENSDIIVFPEYGLTTLGIPRDRVNARPFLSFIPEIGKNPCISDEDEASKIVKEISCAARNYKIYTVINIGEIKRFGDWSSNGISNSDGYLQYNSNIAFDRNGTIVAKYHKKHLYFESQFDEPSPAELSTFKTDFGVEFGLFICFDIIFYEPAVKLVERGIKNFIFSTAWVDELPFLTGIQAQSEWAMSKGVNLLASGYHQPLGGQLGSGIYTQNGALTYIFDPHSNSQLLTSIIPLTLKNENEDNNLESSKNKKICTSSSSHAHRPQGVDKNVEIQHSYLRENLENYTSTILNLDNSKVQATVTQKTVCNGISGFCCTINYKMSPIPNFSLKDNKESTNTNNYNYRLIALDGNRTVADKTGIFHWQVCGVVRCQNASVESCNLRTNENDHDLLPNFETLQLKGTQFRMNSIFKPSLSTLDAYLQYIPFELFEFSNDHEGKSTEFYTNSINGYKIQSLAIIQRVH